MQFFSFLETHKVDVNSYRTIAAVHLKHTTVFSVGFPFSSFKGSGDTMIDTTYNPPFTERNS